MKKKFTTENWEEAVTAVFVRSISDPEFRHLALTHPHNAVAAVAPDLELPRDFHFKFAACENEMFYSYQLPPPYEEGTGAVAYAESLIEQNVNVVTHPPTDNSGTNSGGGQGGGGGGGKGGGSQPTGSPPPIQ